MKKAAALCAMRLSKISSKSNQINNKDSDGVFSRLFSIWAELTRECY